MRMTKRAAALCLAAALYALEATAGPAQEPAEETWIVGIAADPARCHLGRAQRVTIEALVRDYRALAGRCVAVRGYWTGAALLARGEDARAADAHYARRFAARRVGTYGTPALMRGGPRRGGRRVIAIGRVASCEDLAARGAMVMGYCHSHEEGPVLALASVVRRP